jgi:hydrogenase maturation protease
VSQETHPEAEKPILVLGVGNVLLHDEGVGVKLVEALREDYEFSPGVELLEGHTQGLRLIDDISAARHVIVVDAVKNGHPPGTVYRLDGEDLRLALTFKNSMHENDLLETLACCELIGNRPSCVVVGMEPENIEPWGIELTATVAAALPRMRRQVLDEIRAAGGDFSPKPKAGIAAVKES